MTNDGPQKTVVLDVVGLSRSLISEKHTPFLHRYMAQKDVLARDVEPAFPALTCPAQSTFVSGTGPSTHGITANVSSEIFVCMFTAGGERDDGGVCGSDFRVFLPKKTHESLTHK